VAAGVGGGERVTAARAPARRCRSRVYPALTHGDFAPWNVKVSRRQWTVLDWERGELAGRAGWDWFHFVMQPPCSCGANAPKVCFHVSSTCSLGPLLEVPEQAVLANIVAPWRWRIWPAAPALPRQTEGREQIQKLERAAAARWFPENR